MLLVLRDDAQSFTGPIVARQCHAALVISDVEAVQQISRDRLVGPYLWLEQHGAWPKDKWGCFRECANEVVS